MKEILSTLLAVICLLALGCDPDQYVLWAPDGQKAAVIGTDGLHLCDPAGKLTELLVKDVRKVAWFSDSRRIVAARELKVSNWKEARKYLDDARITRIEVEAEKLF